MRRRSRDLRNHRFQDCPSSGGNTSKRTTCVNRSSSCTTANNGYLAASDTQKEARISSEGTHYRSASSRRSSGSEAVTRRKSTTAANSFSVAVSPHSVRDPKRNNVLAGAATLPPRTPLSALAASLLAGWGAKPRVVMTLSAANHSSVLTSAADTPCSARAACLRRAPNMPQLRSKQATKERYYQWECQNRQQEGKRMDCHLKAGDAAPWRQEVQGRMERQLLQQARRRLRSFDHGTLAFSKRCPSSNDAPEIPARHSAFAKALCGTQPLHNQGALVPPPLLRPALQGQRMPRKAQVSLLAPSAAGGSANRKAPDAGILCPAGEHPRRIQERPLVASIAATGSPALGLPLEDGERLPANMHASHTETPKPRAWSTALAHSLAAQLRYVATLLQKLPQELPQQHFVPVLAVAAGGRAAKKRARAGEDSCPAAAHPRRSQERPPLPSGAATGSYAPRLLLEDGAQIPVNMHVSHMEAAKPRAWSTALANSLLLAAHLQHVAALLQKRQQESPQQHSVPALAAPAGGRAAKKKARAGENSSPAAPHSRRIQERSPLTLATATRSRVPRMPFKDGALVLDTMHVSQKGAPLPGWTRAFAHSLLMAAQLQQVVALLQRRRQELSQQHCVPVLAARASGEPGTKGASARGDTTPPAAQARHVQQKPPVTPAIATGTRALGVPLAGGAGFPSNMQATQKEETKLRASCITLANSLFVAQLRHVVALVQTHLQELQQQHSVPILVARAGGVAAYKRAPAGGELGSPPTHASGPEDRHFLAPAIVAGRRAPEVPLESGLPVPTATHASQRKAMKLPAWCVTVANSLLMATQLQEVVTLLLEQRQVSGQQHSVPVLAAGREAANKGASARAKSCPPAVGTNHTQRRPYPHTALTAATGSPTRQRLLTNPATGSAMHFPARDAARFTARHFVAHVLHLVALLRQRQEKLLRHQKMRLWICTLVSCSCSSE